MTPLKFAEDAINLFLEYRDVHGSDEEEAKAKALNEVAEADCVIAFRADVKNDSKIRLGELLGEVSGAVAMLATNGDKAKAAPIMKKLLAQAMRGEAKGGFDVEKLLLALKAFCVDECRRRRQ